MERTPGQEEEPRRKEAGRAYFEVPLSKEESQRHISDRTPEQPPPPYAVEYVRGNLPIVLTVPHGGYISPPSIPSRRKGCLEHDDCSQELARAIYAQMVAYVNNDDHDHDHNDDHGDKPPEPRFYPHLVVLHLNRLKVDVNRPLDGAVDDPGRDTKAVAAHRAYHGCIEEALRWSVDTWGFAHLFDIHGQSHRQVMEFGFLLSTEHLRSSDEQLDEAAQAFLSKSSLSGMERCHSSVSHRPSFCLSAVVRGEKSLGALLQAHGFDSVPSPKYPSPSQTPPFRADMPYFWGAWTTRHYAQSYQQEQDRVRRKWLAFVSTTQVEPTHAIRCDLPTRAAFAHALAQTFVGFIELNYNCEIGTSV